MWKEHQGQEYQEMVARLKGMKKAQEEENKEGDKKEGDKKEGEIKEGEKRKKKNKGIKRRIRGEQRGYSTRRVSWLEIFYWLFLFQVDPAKAEPKPLPKAKPAGPLIVVKAKPSEPKSLALVPIKRPLPRAFIGPKKFEPRIFPLRFLTDPTPKALPAYTTTQTFNITNIQMTPGGSSGSGSI